MVDDDDTPEVDGITHLRNVYDQFEDAMKAYERITVGEVLAHCVTVQQICDAWGYRSTAIGNIRSRNANFPKPLATFGITDVFWRPEVDEFMTAYQKTKPTKHAKDA